VLQRDTLEEARQRIRQTYGITVEENL
jgi:hypothetical protein